MAALAGILQPVIDQLIAQGVDKIILTSHLQQIALEQELAGLLRGVDVIIAGGSNTLLADANDTLRAGDIADNTYPITTTGANGNTTLIVNTDGNYSYVGRLVLNFDNEGNIITEDLDPAINGAYATTDAGVAELYDGTGIDPFADGSKGGEVKKLTDAALAVVTTKDAQIFGETAVFLEGRRDAVRTEETNLGNLSAASNIAALKKIDPSVVISIKNGGGIRDSIGVVDADTGSLLPTEANPAAGKEAGDVSQIDIENSLRFNNLLSLVTLTAAGLAIIMEHAVAAVALGATPGQFAQVGGLSYSYDATKQAQLLTAGAVTTPGERIQNLAVTNENGDIIDVIIQDGDIIDVIIQDGELVGDPNREFRVVTLNFLAGGGDNYPFAAAGAKDRVDTTIGEQQALAEFFEDNFAETPFNEADTTQALDERIQNLAAREDGMLDDATFGTDGADRLKADKDGSNMLAGLGDDEVKGGKGDDSISGGEGNDFLRGEKGDDFLYGNAGDDRLDGGNGLNFLIGGEGDDILVSGKGADKMQGDGGSDIFFISSKSGVDIIVDFEAAFDTLDLSKLKFDSVAEALDEAVETDAGVVFTLRKGAILTINESTFEDFNGLNLIFDKNDSIV
ncbi:MAG: 5'-nucleotidase C-terminal domain-containing protein [Hyphomicrobiales bacterium]|nr:5'-nucleotidase C-terminal domain-containing protein [Hyphomicrobiales bacterium]